MVRTRELSLNDNIPYFDGDEFCGRSLKSRETLNIMMKLLRIPEHYWDCIARDVLEEEKAREVVVEDITSSPTTELNILK